MDHWVEWAKNDVIKVAEVMITFDWSTEKDKK